MSAERFAGFLETMGHRVIEAADAWWYDAAQRSYISFPFDRMLDPKAVGAARPLAAHAWSARFLCPATHGRASWMMACRSPDYGLDQLSANNRSKVRRGLKDVIVRSVTAAELSTGAHRLNLETLLRQGRRMRDGQDYWDRYYAAAERSGCADLWGGFVSGELAAYCVAFRMDNVAHILILRSASRFLPLYVNHALVYSYLAYALRDCGLGAVAFGWEPLQGDLPGLTHFKEGMGFRREPADQAIVLQPWLDRAFRSPLRKLVPPARQLAGNNSRIAKALRSIEWVNEQPPLCFHG